MTTAQADVRRICARDSQFRSWVTPGRAAFPARGFKAGRDFIMLVSDNCPCAHVDSFVS